MMEIMQLELETDKITFSVVFSDNWIRLNTIIGKIDITEDNGKIVIRSINKILLIEPSSTGQIFLTTK